jgi:acetyl esterase/lipase
MRIRSCPALCAVLLALWGTANCAAQAPTRIRDVVYGYKYGTALTMDVLKPATPNGIGVLFMVSGGWTSSQAMIDGLVGLLKPFIERGDVVFCVCHSSQPKYTLDEILPDIQRASRFIHAHAADYGVDPDRLGISGASSGGHLSLMTAAMATDGDPKAQDPIDRYSSRIHAVACFFPPVDMLNYGEPGKLVITYEPVRFAWHVLGVQDKPAEEQQKALRAFSPYYQVTSAMPPTLVLQGDKDPLVPYEQAIKLDKKLEELHVPHKLIMKPGGGHGWPGLDKDVVTLADWFDKYLPAKAKTAAQ